MSFVAPNPRQAFGLVPNGPATHARASQASRGANRRIGASLSSQISDVSKPCSNEAILEFAGSNSSRVHKKSYAERMRMLSQLRSLL